MRQLYIDGVGNFIFEQKKAVYPTVPFFVGSYMFFRVKNLAEFVKELEYFHFGEMNFHRNDSEDKVANYCTLAGVHLEYTNLWDKDEEIFSNAQKMTALRKRFKQKIATIGGKGKAAEKLKRKEKEEVKKSQEESHRLSQEA